MKNYMPYIYILKDKWFSKGEGCVVEEYQANASTGVRVKVMNFQKKHENLLYPLGCYYYCPKSH